MARNLVTVDQGKAGPTSRLPWIDEVNGRKSSLRRNGGWLISAAIVVLGAAYLLSVQTFHKPTAARPSATTPLGRQTRPADARPGANTSGSLHKPVQQPPVQQSAAQVQVAQAKPTPSAATTASNPAAAVTSSTSSGAKQVAARATAQPAPKLAKQLAAKATVQPAPKLQTAAAGVTSPGPNGRANLQIKADRLAVQSAQLPRPGAASLVNGQLVQLGAFATVDQAKPTWRTMEHKYPALKQFNASVIENRDWNGHAFYQFQVGTASQADSRMLCQSLQQLKFRCAVVPPPWRS